MAIFFGFDEHQSQGNYITTMFAPEYFNFITIATKDLPTINWPYLERISTLVNSYELHEIAVYTALISGLFILAMNITSLLIIYEIQNAKNYTSNKSLYRTCYIAHIFFPISIILLLSLSLILISSLFIIFILKNTDPLYTLFTMAITLLMITNLNYRIIRSKTKKIDNETLNLIGIKVTEKEAPVLWHYIKMIAQKGNLRRPDNIVIGMNHCFFVTESPINLWGEISIRSGSTLYLPIPYMYYMDAAEVAAIISHELTHLTFDDTKYTQKFFLISQKLINSINVLNIQQTINKLDLWGVVYNTLIFPSQAFSEYFLDSYHQTIQHWKRTREIHADKISAEYTSKEDLSDALLRVALITPVIEYIVEEHWYDIRNQHTILKNIEELLIKEGFPDPLFQLQSIQNNPLDNHPTLQKRLQLLDINITETLLEKATRTQPSRLLTQLAIME